MATPAPKKQPIQVFVRSRPHTAQEKELCYSQVIEFIGSKELSIRQAHGRTYSFDQVFSPYSRQVDIYNVICKPMIKEVLTGYNCTVFAYGQTGTGKTYTMEGCIKTGGNNKIDEEAGIIPRALADLFAELILSQQEYSVRVSFMELYNEEIFDLLNKGTKSLRIYEDQKQKGSVIISDLEEVIVHNTSEVLKVLQMGSDKRRTAETFMNANSSRSHAVFTVIVHIRETTDDGEEVMKTGKLNFVDLAGSENISRSGAVEKRAREAGNINQSLLTLGRVIKALTEKTSHIPYRESKLTRILQDSLGGRTKTSIIATVSPGGNNLDETLSTLDYAYRARRITNRPEINQRMSKRALINQYTEEIERLQKDLMASRSGSGIMLDEENYNKLMAAHDFRKQELTERIIQIRDLESRIVETEERKQSVENDFIKCHSSLLETQNDLRVFQHKLQKSERTAAKQAKLINFYTEKGKILTNQAADILEVANDTTKNETLLIDKLQDCYGVLQKTEGSAQNLILKTNQGIKTLEHSINDISKENAKYNLDIIGQLKEGFLKNCHAFEELTNKSKMFSNLEEQLTTKLKSTINKNKKQLLKQANEDVFKELENAIPNIVKAANDCVIDQFTNVTNILNDTISTCNQCFISINQMSQDLKHFNEESKESSALFVDDINKETDQNNKDMEKLIQHTSTQINEDEENYKKYNNIFVSQLDVMEAHLKSIRNQLNECTESVSTKISARRETSSTLENCSIARKATEKSTVKNVKKLFNKNANHNTNALNEITNNVENYKKSIESASSLIDVSKQNMYEQINLLKTNTEDTIQKSMQITSSKFQNITDSYFTFIAEMESPISETVQEVFTKVKECNNEIKQSMENEQQFLHDLETKSTKFNDNINTITNSAHGFVGIFQNNIQDISTGIVIPKPSGDTPVKKVRAYPQTLTSITPALDSSFNISISLKEEEEIETNENLNIINILHN